MSSVTENLNSINQSITESVCCAVVGNMTALFTLACCVAISKPRVARNGKELPNARLVSSMLHPDMNKPDIFHTLMLMIMGQFLDHDMSRTAISKIAASAEGQFFLRSLNFSATKWLRRLYCIYVIAEIHAV